MSSEKLKFKIGMTADPCGGWPTVKISVDGKQYFDGEIDCHSQIKTDDYKFIEFEHELAEGPHQLVIEHYGKDERYHHIWDNTAKKVIESRCPHIKSIEIDEIDIGPLLYSGIYTPDYPKKWYVEQTQQTGKIPDQEVRMWSLGWNGQWRLEFQSPFYMWLLENLY